VRLYVNERSLVAQHTSAAEVARQIDAFLQARARYPALRRSVYCARLLPDLQLGDGQPLRAAVHGLPPPTRTLFFGWVAAQGPFLDNEREEIADDLFFFEQEEVTEEGLGEAARQLLSARAAGAYSFPVDPDGRFERSPLEVVRGFEDEPLARIQVTNFWDAAAASAAIAAAGPEPANWPDLLAQCRERFTSLIIGAHCEEVLRRHPFEANVARRTTELLGVLQRLVEETSASGDLSSEGLRLREQHFVGGKAWFTDESDGNKRDFLNDMTFPNPDGVGPALTCFWHGKIKTPQYRIHFEWPIPAPFDRLRIAYIGPKITKR
jgi:hypothetical protein